MGKVILVPEAHTRAQLAALRSIGRAGHRVHAVSSNPEALGFWSNYAWRHAVHPDYESPQFCDWLKSYCGQHGVQMIVPAGGLLAAVRHRFSDFKALLPVANDPNAVYSAGDKLAAFRCWRNAGLLDHHPRTVIAGHGERPDLHDFPLPIYVKGGKGVGGEVEGIGFHRCGSADAAQRAIAETLNRGFDSVLVQGGVSGRQVGVSLLMDADGALAANVVVDCHAEPHSKGTMSLRRSEWHQDVYEDAVRRLKALGWIGCAMVEYRRDDQTGAFHVIEVNARFWQYLHLDIHAGVDFPRLLVDWFVDGVRPEPIKPIAGVVCRDAFPGEVAQLVSSIRGGASKLGSIGHFLLRSADFRSHADLSFPGDRLLYWRGLGRFIRAEVQSLRRRCGRSSGNAPSRA